MGDASSSPLPWVILDSDIEIRQESFVFEKLKLRVI